MQSVFRRSASLPLYTFLLIHTSPLSGSFSLPLISTEGSIHSDIFLGCLFPSPQGFSRKRLRERFITFASSVANVILGSCKRYPWRTHVFALSDASTCRSGCSALRGRLQCTASEMGKKGHRNRQSYSDKRKGREEDSIGALHPPGYFCRTAENDFRHKRMISPHP